MRHTLAVFAIVALANQSQGTECITISMIHQSTEISNSQKLDLALGCNEKNLIGPLGFEAALGASKELRNPGKTEIDEDSLFFDAMANLQFNSWLAVAAGARIDESVINSVDDSIPSAIARILMNPFENDRLTFEISGIDSSTGTAWGAGIRWRIGGRSKYPNKRSSTPSEKESSLDNTLQSVNHKSTNPPCFVAPNTNICGHGSTAQAAEDMCWEAGNLSATCFESKCDGRKLWFRTPEEPY